MSCRRSFVALGCAIGILVGSSVAQTAYVNDKCANNVDGVTQVSGGNLTSGGYMLIQATLYNRTVSGALWWTKVTYTPKTYTNPSRINPDI